MEEPASRALSRECARSAIFGFLSALFIGEMRLLSPDGGEIYLMEIWLFLSPPPAPQQQTTVLLSFQRAETNQDTFEEDQLGFDPKSSVSPVLFCSRVDRATEAL